MHTLITKTVLLSGFLKFMKYTWRKLEENSEGKVEAVYYPTLVNIRRQNNKI